MRAATIARTAIILVLLQALCACGYIQNDLYALHQHNNPTVSELITIALDENSTTIVVPTSPTGLTGIDAFFANTVGFLDAKQTRYFAQTWRAPIPNTLLSVDLTNGNVTAFNYNTSFDIFAYDSVKGLVWACTLPPRNPAVLAIAAATGAIVHSAPINVDINITSYWGKGAELFPGTTTAVSVLSHYTNDGMLITFDVFTGEVLTQINIPSDSLWGNSSFYRFTVDPSEGSSGRLYAFAVSDDETSNQISTEVIVFDIATTRQWALPAVYRSNAYPAGFGGVLDMCNKRIVANMFPPQSWNPSQNNYFIYWNYEEDSVGPVYTLDSSTYQNEYRGFAFANVC